jgi:predicted RNA-binding Zn-ribbon protein involved in translation (DUF1610 family)
MAAPVAREIRQMKVFISHNKADKIASRHLAVALVEQGISVWLDEWEIRPGDSIIGGIEGGLSTSDVFVLVWSARARASAWVGTEVRAYLRRRVEDKSLRIVPVILDDTPLPALVAEYRGFVLSEEATAEHIATEIAGNPGEREVARLLQNRLFELAWTKFTGTDMLPYFVCQSCGSSKLRRYQAGDMRGDSYYCIKCEECGWRDETEIP